MPRIMNNLPNVLRAGGAPVRRQVVRIAGRGGLASAGLLLCLLFPMAGMGSESTPGGTRLRSETLSAFRRYVEATQLRNESELKTGSPFLWLEGLGEAERQRGFEALKGGDVMMKRMETRENGERIPCPGGMIHHWIGLAFIAKANLQGVLRVLQDYDRHSEYYAPDVERSKMESRDGDHFVVFLRFRRHKVITVVLNTEHDVRYFRDGENRAHSRSSATRIAEVADPGKRNEHEKPPGDDGGFLWGMETWWRMEERDGGVYVQSEVVSLTRDIPAGLGWLIGPFVTSIPKETLTFTLEATRRAVEGKKQR